MIKTESLGKTNEVYVKSPNGSLVSVDGTYVTGKFVGEPTFRDEGVYINNIEYEFDDNLVNKKDDVNDDTSSLCLIDASVTCVVSKV